MSTLGKLKMPSNTSTQEPAPAAHREKTDVDVEAANIPAGPPAQEAEDAYPDGWKKIAVIMIGIYLSMFIVALVSDEQARPCRKGLR